MAESEILATLEDVNANLDNEIAKGTDANTALLQVSVARVIRAYLSGVVDQVVMMAWTNPTTTPQTVREIAGKMIAAQVWFNQTSRTSTEISGDSFAQKRYDEAMDLLNGITAGTIVLIDPATDAPVTADIAMLSEADFWPVDDTDRAFSTGMEL